MVLKTDYSDTVCTQRVYTKLNNDNDGSVSFVENTDDYTVVGDYFGCEDINLQNYTCNLLNRNFSKIDSLIALLQSHGITVANNSVQGIKNAIAADKNACYNQGVNNGISDVENHPTKYGYVDPTVYNSAKNTNADYKQRINDTKNILSTTVPYIMNPGSVSPQFAHDPITAAEAQNAKSALKAWLDRIIAPFTEFYTTGTINAKKQLDDAYDKLNV